MRRPVSPVLPLTSSGPLPLSEFWADLRFAQGSPRPELDEAGVQNVTAGGEVVSASFGARLWRFSVTLAPMAAGDADILAGRLDLLDDGAQSFLAVPPFRAAPASDPTGLLLGAAAPQIATLSGGGRTLSLSGLPGHYILTAGDFLAFTYGSPLRYALHRLVTGGRANAAGASPILQVVPPIRPGAVTGTPVTLRNPVMRARLVPGSLKRPPSGLVSVGATSFDVIQTLQKAG